MGNSHFTIKWKSCDKIMYVKNKMLIVSVTANLVYINDGGKS